jgi:4-aminobutyrate aminotransferase
MVDTAAGRPSTNSSPAADLPPTPLPDLTVVPPVWSRITNLVVDHGEGSWLITTDGDRYLDYTSGIGVTNTGHAHPRVVAAVQAQAARLLHGQQNIVYHEPGLRLYERLAGLLPGGPWSAFLANSGAEAVEAAVKLARVATGRPAIVAFRYAFHGRTGQAMALTAAKDVYRGAFEPLPGSVYHAAYPYCYRAAGGPHDPSACTCDWEAELDLLFHQLVYPERVAAIIVEPVIGEGGYIVPPPGFLPRLREITRQHGMLLIADEVQTGFGRTGELFAVRHWDVEPDIMVMAKGIASGLPLSGIVARRELMERFPPGSHGGTYGGNVVACAAALATLDVIEEEGLVANARDRGRQLLDGLRAAVEGRPAVGDVRGLGLMVALELVRPGEGDGRVPDAALTKRIQQACFDRGLLLLTAGTYVNVIRIIPPLVTTAQEVDSALGTMTEALDVAGA